ncbi:hypothetical protein MHBO_001978 [Bonamia ostreae]|uniref:RING-type E3 ubiquitin transferase n=1 Tax=Bonamia ostreae TaxID=126728 RepID=A0ABV2AKV7_9EUKA
MAEKCSICLESIKNAIAVKNCHHEFCFNCIQNWIVLTLSNPERETVSCPLCKIKFSQIIRHDENLDIFEIFEVKDILNLAQKYFSENETIIGDRKEIYLTGKNTKPFPLSRKIDYFVRQYFRKNSENILNRLKPWLERELSVLTNKMENEILLNFILSNLKNFGLDENILEIELKPFLFENTNLFIKEMSVFITGNWMDIAKFDNLLRLRK